MRGAHIFGNHSVLLSSTYIHQDRNHTHTLSLLEEKKVGGLLPVHCAHILRERQAVAKARKIRRKRTSEVW